MTIPASLFVATNPSVLPAGGANLVLNGVFLSNSTRVPIGTVAQFASSADVLNYFGAGSTEATIAPVYFNGWTTATRLPGNMVFVQYPTAAAAAYERGGDISGVTLATLQGYNGTLTIIINGASYSGTVNLSGATSFSNAASIIATALNLSPPNEATFTGTIGPASTTLNVTVASGVLGIGSKLAGGGTSGGTVITAFGTGTGGIGTYTVNNSQSASPTTATSTVLVTYDSTSGGFVVTSGISGALSSIAFPTTNALATNLMLTQATGAVLSQGSAVATPSAFMTTLTNSFTNWATFTTTFNPDNSGFANKELFSLWTTETNGRYAYAPWDTDASAATTLPAIGSYGYWLQQNVPDGTVVHWSPVAADALNLAVFWMGMVASINFDQTGGRITFAYKTQSGLTPGVTDETTFTNLAGNPQADGSFGNGYNVYAAIATANATFQNYQRSTVSGSFKWSDAYINAIWLTNLMQVDLTNLFAAANAIPVNAVGAGMIRTALQPAIQQGLDFGAYSPGVTLSGSQKAAVNAVAGFDIATPLQNQGWFLLINPTTAVIRANRGPWSIVFYYVDSGSVQSISLATVALQ